MKSTALIAGRQRQTKLPMPTGLCGRNAEETEPLKLAFITSTIRTFTLRQGAKTMIEVQNINPIRKGSLLASCDVYIEPWKLTLHDVKIFEKGVNRWVGMPCKELVGENGEKKYIELITFNGEAVKNRFRSQIMGAIDKFLAENPSLEPEDVIKMSDDVPF